MIKHVRLFACLLVFIPLTLFTLNASSASAPLQMQLQRLSKSPLGNHKFSAINDVLQDRQGFLWLATENGLLRYDGLRTIKFEAQKNEDNSLSSQYCWSLLEDHLGQIWIATENGLNVFDPSTKTFTRYLYDPTDEHSLSHNFTTRVIETRDHVIYVATADGLTRISPDRKDILRIHASPQSGLLSNNIRTLMEDSSGKLWIGYYDKGATQWDPNTHIAQHFHHQASEVNNKNSMIDDYIRDIEEDQQGRIWLGTWGGGVIRLDLKNKTQTHFRPGTAPDTLPGGIVMDIFADSQGTVWVSMDKAGVARFNEDTQTFDRFRHDPYDPNTLSYDTVKDVYEDRQHNLWFATFPNDLNRHHPVVEQFNVWYHKINQPNTLSHSAILSLFRSRDGLLWVGTENGLNSLNETTGEIVRYTYEPSDATTLPAAAVLSIAEGPDGGIWVGTWAGGLAKLNRATGEFDRYRIGEGKHAIKSPYVWKVFFDSKDRLWLGTETDGINLYHPESDTFQSFTHQKNNPDSISFDYVWDIAESRSGNFWVGTQYGLNLFNPDTQRFQRFDQQGDFQGLSNARIQDVLEDSQGYVWIATQSGGLKRWDPNTESIVNLTIESGLPSNTIATLQEDQNGFIWAGTTLGIVKINPKSLAAEAILYRTLGIAGDIHNRNASSKSQDGALYFGSTEGLTKFYPSTLKLPDAEPSVTLTDLRILNQSAQIGRGDSPLQKDISQTDSITLDHNAGMFSLEFAVLDYSYTGQMRFSYRLDGFDKEWNLVQNRNEAIYTNLDSGKYRFEVRAQKQNGQWSENIQTLNIRILPSIWLSPIAYLVYVLMIAGFIYLLIRVFLLRMLTATLNNEVHKRTEELVKANSAKTQFLANMSHELRTPLNSVIGFSKRLMVKYENKLDKPAINALDAIHRNGQHLLGLINDILDLSKIESGKMELNIAPCNLKEVITGCIADLQHAATEKGLTIIAPSIYNRQVIRSDSQRLAQMLYNLLSNAIKYTDRGHIAVVLDEQTIGDTNFCSISVIDTGKGIRKEDQDKLFKRFEQMDDETRYIQGFGSGLGLALTAEFASLHGGHVTCHSIYGEGSQFTIFLPLPSL